MPTLNHVPIAKAEMLIRKPVEEVFEAFIDPAITSRFWFTKSSGRLETGKRVQWDWEMYGASADVEVKEIEENKRILIEFGTTVEWIFTPRAENETFVTITNSGFKGAADDIVKQVIDSTEGFTIVLCGLKALLEHDIVLNLVADKAPYAHVKR
ncbi:SRPBCC family protein [Paenibacillus apiarius]|uniref:SRPBCC family protein n=1 Tax=Paenibacillus apiarius TaxID=46240 RepID=A0ABT4DT68_9BACL|nr:SRPBCC family protein [Paenibacillus apiarius]MCY9513748.1 SRPBCC family protein [Paenibacillus apiarius]MCY9520552.1 SRPBCC family protein [Paenibacillus apiarius]MCY9550685.1 SRPBCC family protein [Paenibacillus apiarius]MCY9559206.1 SRPBCC family protein [Paenibacillus apiarius]MCY9682999.1 SRPBCC family protein [Paenibacillus apiarius]